LIGSSYLGPFLLGLLPGFAGVPAGANGFGNLEGRVRPADGGAGGSDLFGTQGGAVRRACVRLLGRPFRYDRLTADQARPAFLALCLADGPVDGLHVVPVDVRDDLPAVRPEALGHVVGVPLGDLALVRVDRDAVVVVEGDQLAKAKGSGKGGSLV
jgi:hypothetical protein